MKLKTVVLIALALLVLAAPAAAVAKTKSGRLDPSFGKNGKLLLPQSLLAGSTEGIATKLMPLGRGSFLLARGNQLFRFEKNGKLDPGFGEAGRVTILPPTGQTLVARGVTIDSYGRILVAGQASRIGADPVASPPGDPTIPVPATSAVVIRLLENGQPDPGFGNNGVVETTFGFERPRDPLGREFGDPIVTGLSVASDGEGHPIVTGTWATQAIGCYPGVPRFITRAYVARFGESGSVEALSSDPTATKPQYGALTATGSGQVVFQGNQGEPCPPRGVEVSAFTIALLGPTGSTEPGTEPGLVFTVALPQLAIDSGDRYVLSGLAIAEPGHEAASSVTRLRPNGHFDLSFGRGGQAFLTPAGAGFAALAVDKKNRPVLGGRLTKGEAGFALIRLTAKGALDRRFGNAGRTGVAFGAAKSGGANAVMVDGAGRILAAGDLTLSKSGTVDVGIARYVPGS